MTLNLSKSYKNNNIDEPAFHVGIALPFAEESGKGRAGAIAGMD